MEIKKGDRFLCKINVIDGKGRTVFCKDKYYRSDTNGCVTNDLGEQKGKEDFLHLENFLEKISDPLEDPINPAHYRQGIEVYDFITAYKLGYELGNAVKYISRAGKKDPSKELEDLQKAKWYLNRKISELEKQEQ